MQLPNMDVLSVNRLEKMKKNILPDEIDYGMSGNHNTFVCLATVQRQILNEVRHIVLQKKCRHSIRRVKE